LRYPGHHHLSLHNKKVSGGDEPERVNRPRFPLVGKVATFFKISCLLAKNLRLTPEPPELLTFSGGLAFSPSSVYLVLFDPVPQVSAANAIAERIAKGDRIQLADECFRVELACWVHPNRTKSRDGMPGYASNFRELMSLAGPFVIRTLDMGKGQTAKERQLTEGSPVLVILGT
jgi:hypothetical protein